MKRWFAWVLLLLTALLPLQPLLASAQTDAGLQACCRRNGAHRCTMLHALAVEGTERTVHRSPCPLWKLSMNPAVVASAGVGPTLLFQPSTAEDVIVLAPSLLFLGLARSRSARAPPTALLFIVLA